MTNDRFKEIYETNRHNSIVMLHIYFLEEGGSKMDLHTFNSNFNIWCMMMNFGDIEGAVVKIIEYLKNRYK